MNDTVNENAQDVVIQEDEITSLKTQADRLGLKYHPNISADKLKTRITKALSAAEADDDIDGSEVLEGEVITKLTKEQRRIESRKIINEQVRVRVTCMDQSKKNQQGVLIHVGNSSSGTVGKFIPFDTEWHISRMTLNALKEKKVQLFYEVKTDKGHKVTRSKLVNAYSVEELPPLTQVELKDLAQRQAMANGTA